MGPKAVHTTRNRPSARTPLPAGRKHVYTTRNRPSGGACIDRRTVTGHRRRNSLPGPGRDFRRPQLGMSRLSARGGTPADLLPAGRAEDSGLRRALACLVGEPLSSGRGHRRGRRPRLQPLASRAGGAPWPSSRAAGWRRSAAPGARGQAAPALPTRWPAPRGYTRCPARFRSLRSSRR